MSRKKTKRAKDRKPVEGTDRIVLATNRRARRNYVLEAKIEAGLILLGSEVKSLRGSTPTIAEGFARFQGETLWLYGVHILPLPQAAHMNHEAARPRQCLLHKRELRKLMHLLEAKGQALVPLQMYFKGSRVKVELGIGRGRRKGDKRSYEREKDDRKRMREAT